METSAQKKWFVYMGDHHEGPFSLDEIGNKMTQGHVTRASYVWADGMPDWRVITEVGDFGSLLSQIPVTGNTGKIILQGFEPASHSTQTLSHLIRSTQGEKTSSKIILAPHIPVATQQTIPSISQPIPQPLTEPKKTSKKTRKLVLVLLVLLLFGGGTLAYQMGFLDDAFKQPIIKDTLQSIKKPIEPLLVTLSRWIPTLKDYVHVIQKPEDVTEEDFGKLKTAALVDFEEMGPMLEVVVSQSDPTLPILYVAGNLPDGAKLQVLVRGIPDTLLNHLSFRQDLEVILQSRLAKTNPIRFSDGKKIPKGEYDIALKIISPKEKSYETKKNLFLGGTKDAYYETRLKEFHVQIQSRVKNEILEVRQFSKTIESQLSSTYGEFRKIRKTPKVTSAQKKSWETFVRKWTPLMGQLQLGFQRWSPEVLTQNYLYPSFYEKIKELGNLVHKINQFQGTWFSEQNIDLKAFDNELIAQVKAAQQILAELKKSTDELEKMPPLPSQIPNTGGPT